MKPSDQTRFDSLYQEHLNVLRLQGKAPATIDAYSRAVRRVSHFFDCCPDQLNQKQLRDYFASLVHNHSWSTVKLDRNGLQSQTRTLNAADFIKLVLQHVLPKGFRRVRDYGYLHGNAKQTLKRVQWVLRVSAPIIEPRPRPVWLCKQCGGQMHIVRTYQRRLDTG